VLYRPLQKITLDGIAQFVIDCSSRDERYDTLCDIYGSFTIGQLILFCEVRTARAQLACAGLS
jgi:superfamily II DNA/RNA helicase